MMLYAAMIVFFCVLLYGARVQQPRDVADNLKKSGAFIPGIRPGKQTAEHIDRILGRLTAGRRRLHHGLPAARPSWY